MLLWTIEPDGGFRAGDTGTGLTSYAFPTSMLAEMALKSPDDAAFLMLQDQSPNPGRSGFDSDNWLLLTEGKLVCLHR